MRIIFFIILFCFAPIAFSNTLMQFNAKNGSPQWSGYYAGLLLGSQFGRSSDKTGDPGYNADNEKWKYSESGVNTSLEFGFNYPWWNIFVGPEMEMGYLNMAGKGTQPSSPGGDTIGKSSSDFYTALRARIGTDIDGTLLFLTGGPIITKYNTQVVDNCNIAPCGGAKIDANKNSYVWGYMVGMGVEDRFAKNWSGKVEYLYVNLDSQSFHGVTDLGNGYDWTAKTYGNIIRAGVNYYFS